MMACSVRVSGSILRVSLEPRFGLEQPWAADGTGTDNPTRIGQAENRDMEAA